MTIAAGFVHRDGVLLCADTQHETTTMKSHATKLHQCEYWDGNIVFAYAGHSPFALSAIQLCMRRIKETHKGEDPVSIIEQILDREYRRVIYKHPDRLIDGTIVYQILFAVHRRSKSRTELHVTHEVTRTQEPFYASIGIGKPLTDYLVLPLFSAGQSEHDVICLATQVVAIAKEHVPACGGMSLLLSLRNDGTVRELFGDHLVNHLEANAGAYFMKAQRLLFQHVNSGMSDEDFQKNLDVFNEYVWRLRHKWNETWEKYRPRPIT